MKNILGRSCLAALLTQTWEIFHRPGALNILYRGCTFCKQACMRDILNTHLPRDRKFKAWEPIPARLCKKCDIGAPECTSVHGIGIVMLKEWMKCATKTQSLLASTPWSHKSHVITLITVHDFIFRLTMTSLTHFEDKANNEDGSTCNHCVCTWFKTPEQPSLHKASNRQSN